MAKISAKKEARFYGPDGEYIGEYKVCECGYLWVQRDFRFCPMCGEPIEWVE